MITVRIEVRSEGYGFQIPRTAVYVDGRYVYSSGNAVAVEHDHLQNLVAALDIDTVVVVSVYTNDN